MRGRAHTASIHVSPACLAPLHGIDAFDKESDDPSLMSYVKDNAGPRRSVIILSKSREHSGGSIMDGARMVSVVIMDIPRHCARQGYYVGSRGATVKPQICRTRNNAPSLLFVGELYLLRLCHTSNYNARVHRPTYVALMP